jgi:hypothetical protein
MFNNKFKFDGKGKVRNWTKFSESEISELFLALKEEMIGLLKSLRHCELPRSLSV